MSYQIQPEEVLGKIEKKHNSISSYIRYASKKIKIPSKHNRTLPNTPFVPIEVIDIYDIDCHKKMLNIQSHTSQLAFPPKTTLSCPGQFGFQLDFNDEEEDLSNDNIQENIILNHDDATLQKLCGISLTKNNNEKNTNMAVLITLSSCSLAAANAARQRRRKLRQ